MDIIVSKTKEELGEKSAFKGAQLINKAIAEKGEANIIVATGASQFEMLNELIKQNIDWTKVTGFHLDEYIGITDKHPASFRKYLKERFVEKVSLRAFHYVSGEGDANQECYRLGEIIKKHPIDVAFVGIGENGHLAFNDPPADFETTVPYIVVNLDDDCRKQQMGEGWFATIGDVPKQAISMSIKQIMKSKAIICSVPDSRKANAVRNTIENEISQIFPASILKKHPACWLFLDNDSAGLSNIALGG
ncbi:MAG: glucosamine-6-phosphate deaminase [Bacteroidales bacterium]|nr:glucosamine-6-phosphate deaminase [Bacteroidales bacterium]